MNAPKQYACFFEALFNFWKQRKKANCFLIGTAVKLHSAIKLFCLRLNKNVFIAKRSSGFLYFVQCKTCLHFVFGKRMCLHLFLTIFYVDLLTRLLVELLTCIQAFMLSNFHVVMVSCSQGFKVSRFHVVKISRFHVVKVSRFHVVKISRFHVVKVAILLESILSINKNFYQFIRIYC